MEMLLYFLADKKTREKRRKQKGRDQKDSLPSPESSAKSQHNTERQNKRQRITETTILGGVVL